MNIPLKRRQISNLVLFLNESFIGEHEHDHTDTGAGQDGMR
jgi:hypothetical protein